MTGPMNADPAVIASAGQKAMGLQGNLEGYLKALLAVQSDLDAAVSSPGAGNQINVAMTDAWQKGSSLSSTMVTIIQTLKQTGVNIGESDAQNQAQVQRATEFGVTGQNDVANNVTSAGKVDLTWPISG